MAFDVKRALIGAGLGTVAVPGVGTVIGGVVGGLTGGGPISRLAPQPTAAEIAARQAAIDKARQAAIDKANADAAAKAQAELAQASSTLNIVPGAGTAVKFLANLAYSLGLASPIYHFPANFDPYDWIATHHFDVLALSVYGVLTANRKAGDQGPGMGEVHGPPETPLQGYWLDHSRIGTLGPGDHTVDELRPLMPPAPPRGFGDPLPVPGAATWQEVVQNINEWPPPPLVDRNTVPGADFARETIAEAIDGARLADWHAAGGGLPAAQRHPEQFYAKYPELAPPTPDQAIAATFGIGGPNQLPLNWDPGSQQDESARNAGLQTFARARDAGLHLTRLQAYWIDVVKPATDQASANPGLLHLTGFMASLIAKVVTPTKALEMFHAGTPAATPADVFAYALGTPFQIGTAYLSPAPLAGFSGLEEEEEEEDDFIPVILADF